MLPYHRTAGIKAAKVTNRHGILRRLPTDPASTLAAVWVPRTARSRELSYAAVPRSGGWPRLLLQLLSRYSGRRSMPANGSAAELVRAARILTSQGNRRPTTRTDRTRNTAIRHGGATSSARVHNNSRLLG